MTHQRRANLRGTSAGETGCGHHHGGGTVKKKRAWEGDIWRGIIGIAEGCLEDGLGEHGNGIGAGERVREMMKERGHWWIWGIGDAV